MPAFHWSLLGSPCSGVAESLMLPGSGRAGRLGGVAVAPVVGLAPVVGAPGREGGPAPLATSS